MNLYSHLTIEERENILKYHTLKMTITQIANILGRNKSTISRELHRNSDLN
ncbi:helix-turn-helix domain-containing protein, partial [Lactobacillus gigeriorum]|uniref:helix-turn-helix domain-containing protein n=1 Tax=Lactobacillus gigeriorum TaxID=1203069 RepID=UPI0012FC75C9